MLGIRLTEFITQLRTSTALGEYDRAFLSSFDTVFPSIITEENLSTNQLGLLLKAFDDRWKAILGLVEDHYTFKQTGNNRLWIKLAHDIAISVNKTYIQVLMPTVINSLDANTLEKIEDCELSDLFIGEDGKALYSVSGICRQFQKRIFYTYDFNGATAKFVKRPLTLSELSQIKFKTQRLPFVVGATTYQNIWSYLTLTVFPGWHEGKGLPRHFLRSLFELIENFYALKNEVGARKNFSEKILLWSKLLQECSIDEVQRLYTQSIPVDGKSIFLIDLLIDGLQCEPATLSQKMLGLARWLCEYDASWVVGNRSELKRLYTDLHAGFAFNIRDLQDFLTEMYDGSSLLVRRSIAALQLQLSDKTKIIPEIMASLVEIYRLRWSEIQDTAEDYLRLQDGINAPWIRLARLLKGGRHIKRSYYSLLIPTLSVDTDRATKRCITDFSLSDYVLSTDGNSLVLLDHCVRHYKAHGTFEHCKTSTPIPLSSIEKGRMQYAHSKYHQYIKFADGVRVEDQPISKDTVLAVHELVNNSIFSIGFLFAHDYDDAQKDAAGSAYHRLYNFLHTLPYAEKERLFAQKISWHGKNVTFRSVLDDVEADKCIAVCGLYFAKMVMDYAPYLRFNPDIEIRARIDLMRTHSRLKVCSKYNNIDDKEAKKRIQIFAASLMSYEFQYRFFGESVTIWDCTNTIGHVAKNIYQIIAPMINSGNYKNARYVYAKIMDTMVGPGLNNRTESWLSWLTRPTAAQYWLESIANQSLFTCKTSWVRPELILATLLPIPAVDAKAQDLLQGFIDDLVHTYAQPRNVALKEIRVNVKFTQLLQSLDDLPRRQILRLIQSSTKEVDLKAFYGIYASYIIRRLVFFVTSTADNNQAVFFRRTSGSIDKGTAVRFRKIVDLLKVTETSEDNSPSSVLATLVIKINRMSTSVCSSSEKARMMAYLEQLRSPVVSLSASEPAVHINYATGFS